MPVFRLLDLGFRCRLRSVPCAVRGCKRRTYLRPVCADHARERLGVELRRRASSADCGLFAVRDLRAGEPICPYLGERRPSVDPRCPEGCPYAVELPGGGGHVDASCQRSYAAMANHRTARPNALLRARGGDVWLVAGGRSIRAGQEICVDYGVHARILNTVRHRTTPSLCAGSSKDKTWQRCPAGGRRTPPGRRRHRRARARYSRRSSR